MPQSDSKKIEDLRQLVNAVVDSTKSGKGTLTSKETRRVKSVLTTMLGRTPTTSEIEAASGD